MNKLYRVEFEVHSNCCIYNYEYYCYAQNAIKACEMAKHDWNKKKHQFHVVAHRINDNDFDIPLEKFNCINSRTWRVNGRNLYV